MTVSHLNGDGHDNRLTNLIYETHRANSQRKRLHGTMPLGSQHWVNRLGVIRDFDGRFKQRRK
jgi:hypothetical protein